MRSRYAVAIGRRLRKQRRHKRKLAKSLVVAIAVALLAVPTGAEPLKQFKYEPERGIQIASLRGWRAVRTAQLASLRLAIPFPLLPQVVVSPGGGGGIGGSANTQVLFNDGGAVAGDAGLTYNKTTDALTVVGNIRGARLEVDSATNYIDVTSNVLALVGTNASITVSGEDSSSLKLGSGANGIAGQGVFLKGYNGAAWVNHVSVTNSATSPSTAVGGGEAQGTNIAGSELPLTGGLGTGNAAPGRVAIRTGSPGASGTTLQTAADRVSYQGAYKDLTAGVATAVVRIAIAQGAADGGSLEYTVEANDGTDFQARSGRTQWQVVNKAGVETCVLGFTTETTDGSAIAQSSVSTLTYTLTCTSTVADTVDIEINAVSGLTETVLRMKQGILHRSGAGGAITWQ